MKIFGREYDLAEEWDIFIKHLREYGEQQQSEKGRKLKTKPVNFDHIKYDGGAYMMQDMASNLVKIGRTSNFLQRWKQTVTHNPSAQLLFVFDCNQHYANEIENALHKQFARYRQSGEWFALPLDKDLKIDFPGKAAAYKVNGDTGKFEPLSIGTEY